MMRRRILSGPNKNLSVDCRGMSNVDLYTASGITDTSAPESILNMIMVFLMTYTSICQADWCEELMVLTKSESSDGMAS